MMMITDQRDGDYEQNPLHQLDTEMVFWIPFDYAVSHQVGYPHRQCFLIIIFTIPIILIIIQEYVMFPNITGRALVQERHVEERSNVYKKLEGVNHDAGFH